MVKPEAWEVVGGDAGDEGVAIAKEFTLIFIDKRREDGGDRINATTHHLNGDRFGLEGDGGL